MRRIGVVGGGAWGTALANAAAAAGHDVTLWLRDPEAAARLQDTRENARYLPGVPLHARIAVTAVATDLAEAGTVLMVTPAQTLRGVLAELAPAFARDAAIVLCAKGIERGTDAFMSEVAAGQLGAAASGSRSHRVTSCPAAAAALARAVPQAPPPTTPIRLMRWSLAM